MSRIEVDGKAAVPQPHIHAVSRADERSKCLPIPIRKRGLHFIEQGRDTRIAAKLPGRENLGQIRGVHPADRFAFNADLHPARAIYDLGSA